MGLRSDDPYTTFRGHHMTLRWSYGVMTTVSRKESMLPTTLASLRGAGFDKPRLFVDGASCMEGHNYAARFGLDVTPHSPPNVRTYGNWALALWELYIRENAAERYAIFQDDFVTYRNLRGFLDRSPYPDRGYLNLFTFRRNEPVVAGKSVGWYEGCYLDTTPIYHGKTPQAGDGAVALVFSQDAVRTLLASPHIVNRVIDVHRGWRAVDGAVATAMNQQGWREYVHNPSLVQHMGHQTSMVNPSGGPAKNWAAEADTAKTFRGESYDALELLPK